MGRIGEKIIKQTNRSPGYYLINNAELSVVLISEVMSPLSINKNIQKLSQFLVNKEKVFILIVYFRFLVGAISHQNTKKVLILTEVKRY